MYGRITDSDEYVTIEQEINGYFEKYLNNDGCCYSNKSIMVEKAECLAHFTFMKSEEQLYTFDRHSRLWVRADRPRDCLFRDFTRERGNVLRWKLLSQSY